MAKKIILKGKKPLINSQGCIKISPKAVESLTGLIKQTGMSASAIVSAIIIQVYENDMMSMYGMKKKERNKWQYQKN